MSNITKNNILPKWLRFILVVVLVLGICFRVANIDRKVYWHDEVLTSFRVAGYTSSEVDREIQDGDIISVKDLKKYQQISSDKSLTDVISSLTDDVHPPLYFLLARLWGNWFGNSVTVVRSLSVVLGLLALPCIYWLCLELFNSPAVAWIAMGLLSISPFHILFAQEARMYSLYTFNVLVSSAFLLRAIRKKTKLNWLAYAASITLGLYTHLLFCLVLVVHGIYVVIDRGFKFSKTLVYYAIASGLGVLLFIPWVAAIITKADRFNEQLSWLYETPSLAKTVTFWLVNYTKLFFDFKADYSFAESIPHLLVLAIFGLALLGLLGYSIYYVYRNSSKKEYYFVLLLLFVPALLLAVPDLLLGGSRSTHLRYAIPTYLGCQLALAYVFAQKIGSKEQSNFVKPKKLWLATLMFVILIGLVSYSVSFQNPAWWNKYFNF